MKVSSRRKSPVPVIGAKIGDVPVYDRRGNLVDSGHSMSDLQSPLPDVTGADNGKVLGVVSGEWQAKDIREVPSGGNTTQVLTKTADGYEWENLPHELPQSDYQDEGKVLTVDSEGYGSWEYPDKELPSYSSADSSKVLQVASNGTLEWNALPASRSMYHHAIHLDKFDPDVNPIARYIFMVDLPVNTNPSTIGEAAMTALGSLLSANFSEGTMIPVIGIRSATVERFMILVTATGFELHVLSFSSSGIVLTKLYDETSSLLVTDIITSM